MRQFKGVLVDAEPKSIQKIQQMTELKPHLRKDNLICGRSGCGSNWAYGYSTTSSNSPLYLEGLDCIRREAEKLGHCLGLCLIHSLAGGTGSGLGLRLVEEADSELSLRLRLCFTVVPHRYGDSPLQAYNSLLCLARLTQLSDSIVLLYNDWLLEQLQMWQSPGDKPPDERPILSNTSINLDQMNRLASDQMSNLLSPCHWPSCPKEFGDVDKGTGADEEDVHCQPLELSHILTALPEARLIRCVSTPTERIRIHKKLFDKLYTEPNNWTIQLGLLQNTLHQCPIDATWNLYKPGRQTGCRPMNCLAALLAYRMHYTNALSTGDDKQYQAKCKPNQGIVKHQAIRSLWDYIRPVPWNPEPIDQWFDVNGKTTRNSVTLAFNSCCITEDLNCLISRAYMRWRAGAYLHWYKKYGCTERYSGRHHHHRRAV
ncbi:unnamed protein product [Echinostoma caproni]|uniref:Tubulin delta chain n=1 Tax=Echinostoma caproni TaxID=27848 RepID=A0A183ABR7_9TREM|nr:unnamed protein product [Echinostoma caproni]